MSRHSISNKIVVTYRELKHKYFPKKHKHTVNDIVAVQLRMGNTQPRNIVCRVSKALYFYHEPIYEVVSQETVWGFWWGYRTIVTEDKVKV